MKEQIIKLLNTPKHQLLKTDEIYKELGLTTEEDYDILGNALEELENEFIITHNKQNAFALLPYFQMLKGVINIKEGGYGFVDGDDFSVHVDEGKTGTAISGDTVIVKFTKSKKASYEGEVTRIVKRCTETIVGPLIKRKGRYFVKATINKNTIWCVIRDHKNAKTHNVVKVEITKYYAFNQVEGNVIEVYGDESEVGMDITMQILASGIKYQFDKETCEEAASLPQMVDLNKYKKRKNLSDELIITIDGDDAKDFDDAVNVKKLKSGNYLLTVCIADVSEYVKENSYLDIEAYTRGTSVYLPDRVIPMLPFELSNGICSLNEGEYRLVMVAEMEFDHLGNLVNSDHYEGIIKSAHRMTYQNVNKILEEKDKELISQYQDIYEMLIDMQDLAKILYDKRIKRGSFDFETSEAKLNLNPDGTVKSIELRERRTAEKLIEEFMLVANESVAEKMTWLDVPFLYRVHDEPDETRLNLFMNRLKTLKQEFSYKNKTALPKALQQFLLDTNAEENTLEKTTKSVISNTLLRTMAKAKYQEINIGHYGLASKCYTHFTSPIRRYPDLLVHRLMKQFLFNHQETTEVDPVGYFTIKVHETGLSSSASEKTAENLERSTVDMKKCEYMEKYIGNVFTGMISSVVNWGLYVTLDNTVEGLVRFDDLPHDYYEVDETAGIIYGSNKSHIFKLGDIVRVKLVDVNQSKKQITFRMMRKLENE